MNANVRAGEKRLHVGGGGEWPISMKKHMQSRAERRRFASRSALLHFGRAPLGVFGPK